MNDALKATATAASNMPITAKAISNSARVKPAVDLVGSTSSL
jgi:hypothetical protein